MFFFFRELIFLSDIIRIGNRILERKKEIKRKEGKMVLRIEVKLNICKRDRFNRYILKSLVKFVFF